MNQSRSFIKLILLLLLLVMLLSACGASLKSPVSGYGRLVDYDCKPVADVRIKAANVIFPGLFSGDSDVISVTSDENGLFSFDVSTNAELISLSPADRETKYFASYRQFKSNVDLYDYGKEIKALTHSSKDSPILIYQDDNAKPDPYTNRKSGHAISGRFENRYKRHALPKNTTVNVAYLRFGKDGGRNVIILDALTKGDISTVTDITSRGIDVKDTASTHVIDVKEEESKYIFYIRSGKKNLAAIVSMTVTYIPISDSVSIQYFFQAVPSVKISESQHININLEECGGYMNRGAFGYYSKFTDSQKRKIEPLTKLQKINPVKSILNEIGFVKSPKQLKVLLSHKLLNDRALEGLIEFDFISGDLLDDLYEFARKNNWKIAVNRLAIDPRVSVGTIIDIINSMPANEPWLVEKLIDYIKNSSSNSSVIVSAIDKFKEAKRTKEQRNNFIRAILQKGLFHSMSVEVFAPDSKDLKIIHSFIAQNSEALLEKYKNNLGAGDIFSASLYAPAALLEKAYFLVNYRINSMKSFYYWARNPNTPLTVLKELLNIPLAINPDKRVNIETFHKFVSALLDNPNSSEQLRKMLYQTLTDKNIDQNYLDYYLKPAFATARSTPASIFSQLVDYELISKNGGGYVRLLQNPMLPLTLSERLVARYGCPRSINETYALTHFKTMPVKSCYSAAVDSKVTPAWVKRGILKNKYKVPEYSRNLEYEYIPPEQMKFLYCLHMDSVKHKLSKNPYTTENILVDIFNKHQQSILITSLAENPATPQWILDKIYRGDYSSRNNVREVDAKLLCNSMIPDSVKRHLKYQRPGRSCNKSLQTKAILDDIKQRKRITEPLNCAAYKEKMVELLKPEATILSYGEIVFKPTNETTYQIVDSAETIKAKKGTKFGIQYILKGDEYSRAFGSEVEIEPVLTYLDDGLVKTESSKIEEKYAEKIMHQLNRVAFMSHFFPEVSNIEKGKWIFELRYRGTVLLKKALIIE